MLTGEIRFRIGFRGKLVLQVRTIAGWFDADVTDLQRLYAMGVLPIKRDPPADPPRRI